MSTLGETSRSQTAIHPDTTIGTVRLTVSDLRRSSEFYARATGLRSAELDNGALAFGPSDGPTLVELHGDSSAPPLDRRATGLYHFAILVPSRRDLAFALARLAEARWPLDGASDHLVSEALYLSDPDGNGIEIYRDRSREEWPRSNGALGMSTLPLDLDGLLGELAGATELQRKAPSGTRIGHVHLQVADLREAEAFYSGLLGFDVMVRGYPGALFVSAGGYHHHIGLNTWNSRGAALPKLGSIGLRSFEVVVPDERELGRVLDRVRAAGIPLDQEGDGSLIRDPSGNGVLLRAA
jgi:catechol 2,3-dioxygenase